VSGETPKHVTLARLVRPQGRRGEIAAEILTDFPERLTRLKSAYLWDGRTPPVPVSIRNCWLSRSHGGQAIFHFEGTETIDAAKRLVGRQVQVPLSERVTLPTDSYFVTDLIGCEVWTAAESADGWRKVGIIKDVEPTGENTPGTPLLVITSANGGDEILIPFAVEICRVIDIPARRIEIAPPPGLLDLNSGG